MAPAAGNRLQGAICIRKDIGEQSQGRANENHADPVNFRNFLVPWGENDAGFF